MQCDAINLSEVRLISGLVNIDATYFIEVVIYRNIPNKKWEVLVGRYEFNIKCPIFLIATCVHENSLHIRHNKSHHNTSNMFNAHGKHVLLMTSRNYECNKNYLVTKDQPRF